MQGLRLSRVLWQRLRRHADTHGQRHVRGTRSCRRVRLLHMPRRRIRRYNCCNSFHDGIVHYDYSPEGDYHYCFGFYNDHDDYGSSDIEALRVRHPPA